MANRNYIKQQKYLHKKNEEQLNISVPAIYATIAIVLYEGGLDADDIAYICGRSQQMWEDHTGDFTDMLIKCYNLTGIQVMSPEQYEWAKKEGLIEDESTVN